MLMTPLAALKPNSAEFGPLITSICLISSSWTGISDQAT